jgi:predicted amidophosphoribosyltransferase
VPRLCRMCRTESDTEECPYCGGPAPKVDEIYEVTYNLICTKCGAYVQKKIDHDKQDILDLGFWESRRCPLCEEFVIHEIKLISVSNGSYDSFLERAFHQELGRGD